MSNPTLALALAQTQLRIEELSGGVIHFEVNEYPVDGVSYWCELSFSAEHDLVLVFMVLDDGTKVACKGYGPSAQEGTQGWARWRTWDELLTEGELWGLASENERYDHSKVDELLAILRPLILG